MAFTLGSINLPRPTSFERRPVEVSTTNTTLNGELKKDISNQREEFVLVFEHISQTQVNQILSEYHKQEAVDFSVSDGSLTIASTSVHVEVMERRYLTPSSEYRERVTLVLREVE